MCQYYMCLLMDYKEINNVEDCIEYLENKIKFYQTHRNCLPQDPKVASRILNQILGL